MTGIPVETAPSGTTSWSTQVVAGTTPNATTIPTVLYPQANGYSIAAGDCPAEATSSAIANLNSAARRHGHRHGAPRSAPPDRLSRRTAHPVSGAVVTLTSKSCPGADAYNLPVTDATGVTMTSVPYGSYSYTVTQGNTAVAHTSVTLTIGANSVQVQSTVNGPWVTYYLPSIVPVAA